jgi:hypothetical protein
LDVWPTTGSSDGRARGGGGGSDAKGNWYLKKAVAEEAMDLNLSNKVVFSYLTKHLTYQ